MVINNDFQNEIDNINMKIFSIDGLELLIDEDDVNVKFSIFDFRKQCMSQFSIKRSVLSPATLKKEIVRRGGICPQDIRKLYNLAEEYVNKIIIANESSTWSYAHCNIGFREFQGELVFAANSIITKNGIVESRYYGRVPLQPKGKLEELKQLYQVLVKNQSVAVPLSILGVASVVLSFANHVWETHVYNFIVHLLGTSSIGKSSILMLISSFSGNPSIPNGTFLSYLSTPNSIIESLCDSYGHSFVIDEFSTADSKKNWTSEVYTIANGMRKNRSTAGGMKLQESKGFEGVYVSSGEISMSCKCGTNEGISARLLEITADYDYSNNTLDKFTTSSQESDYIKTVASNNYGLIVPAVAQYLLKNPSKYNYLRTVWLNKTKDRYKLDAITLNIGNRVMEYVAIIMTACEVLQDVLEVELDKDKIFEYFYFQFLYKRSDDENIDVKVYDAMKSFISANRKKLYDANFVWGVPPLDEEHIGYFVDLSHYTNKDRHKGADGKYYDYLAIFPVDTINTYLKGKGFEDPKFAINTLRKKKLIKASRSGSNPKLDYPIDGINVPMYAIWLDVSTTNVNHAISYI
ncbi:MAG: DUF927 domain-containing protein [Clostridiales bacterium]|nr:DUF927 domain-containing protein [Clostridiales bacterium]